MKDTPEKELISLAEVRRILQINYQTAQKMREKGQITPVPVGDRDLYRRREILAIRDGEGADAPAEENS